MAVILVSQLGKTVSCYDLDDLEDEVDPLDYLMGRDDGESSYMPENSYMDMCAMMDCCSKCPGTPDGEEVGELKRCRYFLKARR